MYQNILLPDCLKDTIRINGAEVKVRTDFRLWLWFAKCLEEYGDELDFEKFSEICDRIIIEYPENGEYIYAEDLLLGLYEFYKGIPQSEEYAEDDVKKPSKKQDFDFYFDADYIYCSFASFYGIRLLTIEYMHWWEFLTLFRGLLLSDQTSMNLVVTTRQTNMSKVPKYDKQRMQKLKKQFALPKKAKDRKAEKNLAAMIDGLGKAKKEE